MRRAGACLIALMTVTGFATAAEATPITVNAGDSLTFNFDATGLTPAPPYTAGILSTGLSQASLDAGDVALYTLWADLNGTGALLDTSPAALALQNLVFHPSTLDGVFSVTLNMTAGSMIVDPSAVFSSAAGSLTVLPQQPPAVAEPATLTLLGLGVVGAGARRWRQRNELA